MENLNDFDSDPRNSYLESSQSNYIDSGHGAGNPAGYLETANASSSPDYVVFNRTVTHPVEGSAEFNTTSDFVSVELGKILSILKNNKFVLDPSYNIVCILAYSIVIFLSVILNLLVIAALVRKQEMRTPRVYLFGNTPSVCRLLKTIPNVAVFMSSISIMIIAVDRYFYITKSNSIKGIVVNGELLDLTKYPSPYAEELDQIYVCIEDWRQEDGVFMVKDRVWFTIFCGVVQFCIPICVITYAYYRIAVYLKMHRHPSSKNDAKQRKTNCMLLSISLIFFISWFPFTIVSLVAEITSVFDDNAVLGIIVFAICHLIEFRRMFGTVSTHSSRSSRVRQRYALRRGEQGLCNIPKLRVNDNSILDSFSRDDIPRSFSVTSFTDSYRCTMTTECASLVNQSNSNSGSYLTPPSLLPVPEDRNIDSKNYNTLSKTAYPLTARSALIRDPSPYTLQVLSASNFSFSPAKLSALGTKPSKPILKRQPISEELELVRTRIVIDSEDISVDKDENSTSVTSAPTNSIHSNDKDSEGGVSRMNSETDSRTNSRTNSEHGSRTNSDKPRRKLKKEKTVNVIMIDACASI